MWRDWLYELQGPGRREEEEVGGVGCVRGGYTDYIVTIIGYQGTSVALPSCTHICPCRHHVGFSKASELLYFLIYTPLELSCIHVNAKKLHECLMVHIRQQGYVQ